MMIERESKRLCVVLMAVFVAVSCTNSQSPNSATSTSDVAVENSNDDTNDRLPVSLPGAPGAGMIVEKNVMVAMRDGVHLATDLYRPADGKPHAVVLVRTPYGSETPEYTKMAKFYVKHGYAMAIQDCRGKSDSEGDWYGKRNEAQDGSDTITWLGTRPWSTGKVGMTGVSYMGMVQYLVADQENPYLKALVPQAPPVTLGRDLSDFDHSVVYSGRESWPTMLQWMLSTDGRMNQDVPRSWIYLNAPSHLALLLAGEFRQGIPRV